MSCRTSGTSGTPPGDAARVLVANSPIQWGQPHTSRERTQRDARPSRSRDELLARERELDATYQRFRDAGLALDLTRGKPSAAQLALSDGLDAIEGGFVTADGTDTRNYGGLDGLADARALGAALLGVRPEEVIAGGNSSLTLMYFYLLSAWLYGPAGPGTAWRDSGAVRFLCPVPGYDRHFTMLEELGIEMINVAMRG